MKLDIRLPIGLMFTLIGAVLLVYGLAAGSGAAGPGFNINAAWGGVMAAFGACMLVLAGRGRG